MIKTKPCKSCGNLFEFADNKKGNAKMTCSKECAIEIRKNSILVSKSCSICGNIVETPKSNQNPRCEICRNLGRHQFNCSICGKIFRSNHSTTRTCSKKCASELSKENLVDLTCFSCGKAFQRPSNTVASNKRVFCSNKCSNREYSLDNPTRYGGNYKRLRREIMKRDGKCLLCSSVTNLECHHFKKMNSFSNPNDSNFEDNMGIFCKECHILVEGKYSSYSDFKER